MGLGERLSGLVRGPLAGRVGDEDAEKILIQTRANLGVIGPEIPDVGGLSNCFTPILSIVGWVICLHKAMRDRGHSAEDTTAVCVKAADSFFGSWPRPLLWVVGRVISSRPARNFLRRQAARSHERRYPEDWVWNVLEQGDEFTLEFEECGVQKLYAEHGVEELRPFCNFFDVAYSRHMGLGLDASETLGLGHSRCSMRFCPGRETPTPKALEGMLE